MKKWRAETTSLSRCKNSSDCLQECGGHSHLPPAKFGKNFLIFVTNIRVYYINIHSQEVPCVKRRDSFAFPITHPLPVHRNTLLTVEEGKSVNKFEEVSHIANIPIVRVRYIAGIHRYSIRIEYAPESRSTLSVLSHYFQHNNNHII